MPIPDIFYRGISIFSEITTNFAFRLEIREKNLFGQTAAMVKMGSAVCPQKGEAAGRRLIQPRFGVTEFKVERIILLRPVPMVTIIDSPLAEADLITVQN